MRCYKVTARRGHCGSGRYIPITFALRAENMIEAMDRAKAMPGVKHTLMILAAQEITWTEYAVLRSVSAYDRCERKEEAQ